jgi:GTPase
VVEAPGIEHQRAPAVICRENSGRTRRRRSSPRWSSRSVIPAEHWRSLRVPTPVHGAEESVCYVVSVGSSHEPHERAAQLAEILALVRSQGGRVAGQEICHVAQPNPRTLLGKGTAQEIASRARDVGATMLVLDAELTPSQTRNLEDVAGISICDREAIILNVFIRHARTRRARIQIEIAQLEYLRPRIRGVGLDMDQQTGGSTYARGPGETASELLARKLDARLAELNKTLRRMEISAETQRKRRRTCERMVLVGYTNAGKTSLMNALTAAELSARDMPFETLDTTSRCLTRHGAEVVLPCVLRRERVGVPCVRRLARRARSRAAAAGPRCGLTLRAGLESAHGVRGAHAPRRAAASAQEALRTLQ